MLAVAVTAIIFTAPLGALLTDLLIRKGNIFRPVTPLPVQGESDESAIAGKGSVVQFDRIAAGTSARDGEDQTSGFMLL